MNAELPVPVLKFDGSEASMVGILAELCRPVKRLPPVYPGYLAHIIRKAIEAIAMNAGEDRIIEPDSVRTETLGNSRYAVTCADFNGQEYKITVELAEPRTGEGEAG